MSEEFTTKPEELEVITEPGPIDEPHEVSMPTRKIETATPYNLSSANNLYFLCRDNNNNLFVIMKNFNSTEINSNIIPFAEDTEFDFASRKIVCNSLRNYLDCYTVDMQFYVEDNFASDKNPTVYMYGTSNSEDGLKTTKLEMSSNVFTCINFVNEYVKDNIECEHDLALATVAGSKITNSAEFFVVDKVEVVSIVPAIMPKTKFRKFVDKIKGVKEITTNIAMVIKVTRFIDKDLKESDYILTTFNASRVFDEDKFKNKSIEDIQNTYYGDSDQYISTLLTMDTRLLGAIDKNYMIIRGKNKYKNLKIFLFDDTIVEELNRLINEF